MAEWYAIYEFEWVCREPSPEILIEQAIFPIPERKKYRQEPMDRKPFGLR